MEELAGRILRWGEGHFDRDGSKRFLYARVLFTVQLFREVGGWMGEKEAV